MISENLSLCAAPVVATFRDTAAARASQVLAPFAITYSATVTPCSVAVLIMPATLWAAGPGVALQPLGVAVVVPSLDVIVMRLRSRRRART